MDPTLLPESALYGLSDSATVVTRVPAEQCGDYPAPCNCDDPVTHTGRH